MEKTYKKLNHIIDRIKFKLRYIVANTILKNKIDAQNNTFNMMDDKNLIDEITSNKKSFARFGDGELSLVLEEKFDLDFQQNSKELRDRLRQVLQSNLDNLIIGISRSINDPSEYSRKVQKYYRTFNSIYREKFKTIIPPDRVYGNASITRFYIDYEDDKRGAHHRAENIKKIWKDRNVLVVEGVHSRLGVGNDLLGGAKKIRRILVPEKSAFMCYDEILNSVLKNVKENELVLIAAGPAATILAYDLAEKGIQAVDIGHVDIEYEWMRMGATKRVAVKGKYVNEIKGKKYEEDFLYNPDYENSIIERIDRKKA